MKPSGRWLANGVVAAGALTQEPHIIVLSPLWCQASHDLSTCPPNMLSLFRFIPTQLRQRRVWPHAETKSAPCCKSMTHSRPVSEGPRPADGGGGRSKLPGAGFRGGGSARACVRRGAREHESNGAPLAVCIHRRLFYMLHHSLLLHSSSTLNLKLARWSIASSVSTTI